MLVPLCDCCERAEAVVDCDSASTGGSPGLKREMRACGRAEEPAVAQLRLQLRDAEEAMARRQQQQVRKTEEAMVRRLRLLETQVHDGQPNLTMAQL